MQYRKIWLAASELASQFPSPSCTASYPCYNWRVFLSDKDIRIVLVRPRNPLNIGAAARAIQNFGFEDLVLVSPHDPIWRESKAAPGAEVILRNARVVPQLLDAIEDRTLVIGTSSLSRRSVSQPVISLDQLSALWTRQRDNNRVAVVFGSEKTGLSRKDLSYCHWIVRIPTIPDCPSMNLGQAVAVCCYELRKLAITKIVGIRNHRLQPFQSSGAQSLPNATEPGMAANPLAAVGEVERLLNEIEQIVSGTAEPARGTERARKTKLRRLLLRLPLTRQDLILVLGVLRDLSFQLKR